MSSGKPTSRYRKQRFPRLDRRRSATAAISFLHSSLSEEEVLLSDDDDVSLPLHSAPKRIRQYPIPTPPARPVRPAKPPDAIIHSTTTLPPNCRPDKRARDEHNEQERSRRRELAVIYELIRCSFSDEDLRYLGSCNAPKSVDKLSYPQVLQIAYHLVREEQHNLLLYEQTINDLKRVEKEFVERGISVPNRPYFPSVSDTHRKIVHLVDNLLKQDKSARTLDGVYEVTPAERASMGDRQLAALRPQFDGSLPSDHLHHDYGMSYRRRLSMQPSRFISSDLSVVMDPPQQRRSVSGGAVSRSIWPQNVKPSSSPFDCIDEDNHTSGHSSHSPSPLSPFTYVFSNNTNSVSRIPWYRSSSMPDTCIVNDDADVNGDVLSDYRF